MLPPIRRMPSAAVPGRRYRLLLSLLPALIVTFLASAAHGQQYTSIVIFGDSLCDTGNVAHLTELKYGVRFPGPVANYADGRFTDGDQTIPAARQYFGLWIEQLAAMLPAKPIITDSLDGGTNYAYGSALTGPGTQQVNLTPTLFVDVDNIGQQITDYLATSPVISNRTLFVIWGGSNDILQATSAEDIFKAAINETNNIQRLIDAGATQFLIPNLPPLGSTPALNGSGKAAILATAASAVYNQLLNAGVAILKDFNRFKHLQVVQMDVFSLFNQVAASPAKYGLANVTSISQGVYTVDPDTYLFWDDLHPTTKGHNILAVTAAAKLAAQSAQTVAAAGSGGR